MSYISKILAFELTVLAIGQSIWQKIGVEERRMVYTDTWGRMTTSASTGSENGGNFGHFDGAQHSWEHLVIFDN